MKKTKKLVSVLLAAVMVLSMSVSVLAAKVDNETGHSYKAYQIFSGTQADGDAALGDIEWGTGIEPVMFLCNLQYDDRFKRARKIYLRIVKQQKMLLRFCKSIPR